MDTQEEQMQNFLWIRSTSGQTMIPYVFEHENEGMHAI